MSVSGKNEKTAHLAWCAMIALHLARQEGRVRSEQQENLFLTRWFADAERQRRFSRDVATDIHWMLQQGRSLGVRAQLPRKLDYLWQYHGADGAVPAHLGAGNCLQPAVGVPCAHRPRMAPAAPAVS